MAFMFGMPIILFILAVYIWLPVWYTKISGTTPGTFVTILIAVFIAIIFFSYFRMHFKWEMNEQLYLELKHKQKKYNAANQIKWCSLFKPQLNNNEKNFFSLSDGIASLLEFL